MNIHIYINILHWWLLSLCTILTRRYTMGHIMMAGAPRAANTPLYGSIVVILWMGMVRFSVYQHINAGRVI